MKTPVRAAFMLLTLMNIISGCSKTESSGGYAIQPVPFTAVKLTDNFWAPRIKKNASVTIPIALDYCESTGRIKNFEIASGLDTGKFQTIYPFDDSDVFKIIEGAAYSLQSFPDPVLDAYLDTLIKKISLAQEDDGYLYTNRTIADMHEGEGLHEWASVNRWEMDSVLSHELYNIGHLYEAAVAHYQATGKKTLLDVAIKSADLVTRDFLGNNLKVYPGHQVIEMGLIKLFHVTGNDNYLKLAKYFLDIRGPGGQKYNQAHVLPANQTEAVGHSVRATYMYSAMADIAALHRDTAYLDAVTRIWEDITFRKMYITGGIGATGDNEGFAGPYELPNLTAYCETCASIGNIFFNHRLFLNHGRSEFIDVLEKTLYNSMLSGVSMSADRFFYPNPLESDGRHARQPWFGCACCPSNVARFMPAIPGYIYAVKGKDIYSNLYISNDAVIHVLSDSLQISQKTGFPWNGKVEIIVTPSREEVFTFHLRIPGWARNEAIPGDLYTFTDVSYDSVRISLNKQNIPFNLINGYAVITRKWSAGDTIGIDFPMPVRKIVAHERISDNRDKVAFQRGPIIYCAEWPDNNSGNVRNLVINSGSEVTSVFSDLLGGIQILTATGSQTRRSVDGKIDLLGDEQIKFIPYSYWNNRGAGEMAVWMPTKPEAAKPLPARTIAFLSKVRASKNKPEIIAVNDQAEPGHSGDKSIPYYSWFPAKNSWEYVQYDFAKPETISKVKVYWVDDRPEAAIRVPDEWEVLTLNENVWEPVVNRNRYKVTKDGWDSLIFSPVRTRSVKIKVKLKKDYSGGIYEWMVQ